MQGQILRKQQHHYLHLPVSDPLKSSLDGAFLAQKSTQLSCQHNGTNFLLSVCQLSFSNKYFNIHMLHGTGILSIHLD